ncbi:hypothetical protein BGW38_005820 [Lunasporangiospora selenospora]|uniref:Pyrroline-5-carboxylate reductase n=1 Tax=Lunasporangiospora selenospora TaxID=979761 RepID=A0A9P6KI45_9FUNG|nr:hypothetical protein BGW38_005820 [Lunasporangiospora selenospora]
MTNHPRIAFIGGGNMAEAIIGGLLSCGYPISRCVISEPVQARCDFLHAKYPGLCILSGSDANRLAVNGSISSADESSDASAAATVSLQVNATNAQELSSLAAADVIILAVKPQVLRSVVVDLAPALLALQPLVISIAAGIETSAIARFMAEGGQDSQSSTLPPVIRVMPNTPALVLEGAAGMYATADATAEHRQLAESLMAAVSKKVCWVESEGLIDTVTGISGSGPAYFFLMMEAMEEAGVALGMDRETAKALTIQTCLGAAKMAQSSEDDLKTLRVKVTSPQGTTDAAIKTFEAGGFRDLVQKGVAAADARSRTLAKELGGSKL